MKYFRKFAVMMLFPSLLFCGCGSSPAEITNATDGNTAELPDNSDPRIDLTEFTAVVCPDSTSAAVKSAAYYFQRGLTALTDMKTTAEIPESGKAILLGDTPDAASAEAAALLNGSQAEHSYALLFKEDRIAIVGSDSDATMVGMKYFLTHYAESAEGSRIPAVPGDQYVGTFGDEITIFQNLVQWELKMTSIIEQPDEKNRTATLKYPSIIELNHQPDGEGNGILIATGERWIGDHLCPVYRSTDGGATWTHGSGLEDPFHPGFRTAYAPCVFELPYAVGDMPAGTLILGADSINLDWSSVYIVLFRSFDQGLTWDAFATVASAPAAKSTGGVWEPNFVCTEDGTLIVHYSDETDPVYNQKLVLTYTKDGVNWSDPVDTVALADYGLRPGMPVVTRMGDGRYFMAYEIVGMSGNPIYCKITEDPLDWGDPADAGKRITSGRKSLAATPWVSWSPVGGGSGMLVVTGWRMATGSSKTGSDIFVSFNNGDSWTTIDNYYSYTWASDDDTWGYSASIFFSDDGKTMYYMANPPGDNSKPSRRTTWFTLYKIEVT